MRTVLLIKVVCLCICLAACSTMQSRFVWLDSSYPAHAKDCKVDIIKNGVSEKKFSRISRIDVHLEKTFFTTPGYNDVLPELIKQACLSGADAVIDIQERSSRIVEDGSYHITAIGIKYLE